MNARQLAIILASLRCLQEVHFKTDGNLSPDLKEILNDDPDADDTLVEEIDAICEELNVDNRYTVILTPPDYLGLEEDLFLRVEANDPVEAYTVACNQAAKQNDIDPDVDSVNFRLTALLEGWPAELSAYVI